MNFIPDKFGNSISTYKYDDWNEYIDACVLSKCIDDVVFTPIFEGKEDSNKSSMELILDCLNHEEESKILDTLKSIISNDTYYVLWMFEARILKKKIYDCIKRHKTYETLVLRDLIHEIICFRTSYTSILFDQIKIYIEHVLLYDSEAYLLSHIDKIVECLNENEEKLARSIVTLTEGFETNPIKAFIRFNYFEKNRYHRGSYDMRCYVVDIYWIYFFFTKDTKWLINYVHFEDVDLGKVFDKNSYFESFCITYDSLRKIQQRHQKQLDQMKEQLEEQHRKEIEELLAPGGSVYQAAKKRFEDAQEILENDGLD